MGLYRSKIPHAMPWILYLMGQIFFHLHQIFPIIFADFVGVNHKNHKRVGKDSKVIRIEI